MGSILAQQSGYQEALGMPSQSSSTSTSNPFMQQMGSYDPSQYSVGQSSQTGFNSGTGSYNFNDPSMPQFSAGATSTNQMQNPQGANGYGQVAPGSLGAQAYGNTLESGANGQQSQAFSSLMALLGGQSQNQNLTAAQNPATLPKTATPANAAQKAITTPTTTKSSPVAAAKPVASAASNVPSQYKDLSWTKMTTNQGTAGYTAADPSGGYYYRGQDDKVYHDAYNGEVQANDVGNNYTGTKY